MIITLITILACVAMFFYIRKLASENSFKDPVGKYCLMPMQVKRGEYYRLISYAFIHVELYHIILNMYSLYNLGSFMEGTLGIFKYLLLLLAGILGSGALITFYEKDFTRTIGMSGGIYALLGAYIVLLAKFGLLTNPSIRIDIIKDLGMGLIISLLPGVSLWGHLGGLLTGLILGFLII